MRIGLRWKIVGITTASMVALTMALLVSVTSQARVIIENDLRERARAAALGLAEHAAPLYPDRALLQQAAEGAVQETAGVAYVAFRDASGSALTEVRNAAMADGAVPATAGEPSSRPVERDLDVGGVRILEVSAVVGEAARPGAAPRARSERPRIGLVQIGFRVDALEAPLGRMRTQAMGVGLVAILAAVAASLLLGRMLTTPLERLSHAAAGLARGDLGDPGQIAGNDEFGDLGASFQTMTKGLRNLLGNLQAAVMHVERQAARILETATQQAAMASQQASAIADTGATASEIAEISKRATAQADAVAHVAQKSEQLSDEGQRAVEEATRGIESLGEQVRAIAQSITDLSERTLQIGDIISTVKDLAEQSNLLALNASIEASRAGEHGRGFAVVAIEMRNLAEQSKTAVGQVRAILGEVQKGTRSAVVATEEGSKRSQAAVTLAQRAGEAIVGLAHVIRESSATARQIAANTRQQMVGVEQMVTAIQELSAAINEAAKGTHEMEKVTSNLNVLSKHLSGLVARYTVSEGEAAPAESERTAA